MPSVDVLILTALDFEAKPIARKLGLRFATRTLAIGKAGADVNMRLGIVGPGAAHLPREPPDGCTAVIMAGLGGALAPDLRRNDIVVDEQSDLATDASLRHGGIASVASLTSTPVQKAELHRTTGALVVDMENAIARDWARRHRLPFLGLRAVSDTASETLDPATLRIIDDAGFTRTSRLARELILKPKLAVSLWRLRTARDAVDALTIVIADLLSAKTR